MSANQFEPIQLQEMDRVKLMNRIDRKFWFNEESLLRILGSVDRDYYVLDIEGQHEFSYTSTYYDTPDNEMYIKHHNGNLNRYKIRRRSYISSGISFLEIKFKNNKGQTSKKRIRTENNQPTFSAEECEFICNNTPYSCEVLVPSLNNKFSRMTLVNRNFMERCTIDRNLQYASKGLRVSLDNLAIVEIKTEGRRTVSPISLVLREERIRASGFSKYCMGRALTSRNLKRNNLKSRMRQIEKSIRSGKDLYNIIKNQ